MEIILPEQAIPHRVPLLRPTRRRRPRRRLRRRNSAPPRRDALPRQQAYTQGNLATTYARLGRYERALQIEGDVYQGYLRHLGEEHGDTLITVNNYVNSLIINNRSEEAQVLMRKMIPVARRTLGEGHETTLQMRWNYALALYRDAGATVDNLREAVTTLEDTEQIARRVLGGAHPLTGRIEFRLREAREELAARETPSPSA